MLDMYDILIKVCKEMLDKFTELGVFSTVGQSLDGGEISAQAFSSLCRGGMFIVCSFYIKFKSYKSSQSVLGKRFLSGTHLLIMFCIRKYY